MRAACFVHLTLAISMLAGCTGEPAATSDAPSDPPPPADRGPSPAVRGAQVGLEVVSWVVDDSTGLVSRTLSRYESAADVLTPSRTEAWRVNGLRMLRIPASDLEPLMRELRTIGLVRREWFGQLPRWTPIATSAAWNARRTLMIDAPARPDDVPLPSEPDAADPSRRIDLAPGTLRLLARAYVTPILSDADRLPVALTIELIPHFDPSSKPRERLALEPTQAIDERALGISFRRAAATLAASGDDIFLIVPERPDAAWIATEEQSNEGAPLESAVDTDRPPTLGEAMLTDYAPGRAARTRVLVALIARVPDEFGGREPQRPGQTSPPPDH